MAELGSVEISDLILMLDQKQSKITLQIDIPLNQAMYAHLLRDAFRVAKEQVGIRLTLSEIKRNRSLTQNAYAWLLMQKLADRRGVLVEEIYTNMLSKYGVPVLLRLAAAQKDKVLFPHFHLLREERKVKKGEEAFAIYSAVCGSSLYTVESMEAFLDGIIAECKAEGIDTTPPEPVLVRGGRGR